MAGRLMHDAIPGFFDEIVRELHGNEVFKTYDEPKGPVVNADRDPRYKITHGHNHAKNEPGRRHHLGDQPFDGTVSGAFFNTDAKTRNPMQPSQREILDKTRSIQEAIKKYVPQDKFVQYVRYFSENLHKPENAELVQQSFANMAEQLGFVARASEEFTIDNEQLDRFISLQTTQSRQEQMGDLLKVREPNLPKFEDGTPNHAIALRAIGVVGVSKNLRHAPEFPELLLSLAVFQAAHIGYRREMQNAVDRAAEPQGDLPPLIDQDEHENATAVVQESLRQFDVFLIYSGLLPLILMEHEKLSRTPGLSLDEDSQTRMAITNGWQAFFKGQVLRSDTLSNGAPASKEYESERLTSVCPAKPHLRGLQSDGMLEAIFSGVTAHRDILQDQIDMAGNYAEKILSGQEVPELNEIRSKMDASYGERINERLASLGLDYDGKPFAQIGSDERLVSQAEAEQLFPLLRELEEKLPESDRYLIKTPREALEAYAGATEVTQKKDEVTIVTAQGEIECNIDDFTLSDICWRLNDAFRKVPEEADLYTEISQAIPERARSSLHALEKQSHVAKLKQQQPTVAGLEDEMYIQRDEIAPLLPSLEQVADKLAESMEAPVEVLDIGVKVQALKDYAAADEVSQSGKEVTFRNGEESKTHKAHQFELKNICKAVDNAFDHLGEETGLREEVNRAMPERARQLAAVSHVASLSLGSGQAVRSGPGAM